MTAAEQRQELLRNLSRAEQVLRANLLSHGLDETARAHLDRSLAHVHEAYVAINEIGKARSVQQLLADMEKVEALLARVRQ